MSEEQVNEETEVEGHGPSGIGQRWSASDEPRDEAEGDNEVEAHGPSGIGQRWSASDEPRDEAEGDNEVEAHGSGFKVDYPRPS